MMSYFYNIFIEKTYEIQDQILYHENGYIVSDSLENLKNKLLLILESALDCIENDYGISRNEILDSIEKCNFDIRQYDTRYSMHFEIVNLSYNGQFKPESYKKVITDKYDISILPSKNNEIILDRYIVFEDGYEMRFEVTDVFDDSGTKFNIGDTVKLRKDPFNDDYIIKGKIGPNRKPRSSRESNVYCVEKNDDNDIYFDDIHESELILLKR